MSYQIRGWHSQVFEVAHDNDPIGFWGALQEDPLLNMFVTQIPTGGGGPVMSPMVDGQNESLMWLRVECPASMVPMVYVAIDTNLRTYFPSPPAG